MQNTNDARKYVEGLVREGKYREALAGYLELFRDADPDGRACYGMGYCHYKLGNYSESREALNQAMTRGHSAAAGASEAEAEPRMPRTSETMPKRAKIMVPP